MRMTGMHEALRWSRICLSLCLELCLELRRPASIIFTPAGDLIKAKEFSQVLFVKELRCPVLDNELKYGYNFYDGEIGRDRQTIISSEKKAFALA